MITNIKIIHHKQCTFAQLNENNITALAVIG